MVAEGSVYGNRVLRSVGAPSIAPSEVCSTGDRMKGSMTSAVRRRDGLKWPTKEDCHQVPSYHDGGARVVSGA